MIQFAYLMVAFVCGAVCGALVYRNNAKRAEDALLFAQGEIARLTKLLDELKAKYNP